jgi:hypothetical protein
LPVPGIDSPPYRTENGSPAEIRLPSVNVSQGHAMHRSQSLLVRDRTEAAPVSAYERETAVCRGPHITKNWHIVNITIALAPLVSLGTGILILVVPRLLNYIVALYLIVIGLIGLFGFDRFKF